MTYTGTCLKCEAEYTRTVDEDPFGNLIVGNIQSTLCPDCEKAFNSWGDDMGYFATGCWENYIDEWFEGVL